MKVLALLLMFVGIVITGVLVFILVMDLIPLFESPFMATAGWKIWSVTFLFYLIWFVLNIIPMLASFCLAYLIIGL